MNFSTRKLNRGRKTRARKHRTKKTRSRPCAGSKSSKKWVTAIVAAQKSLNKTGSVKKAHKMLRQQALSNAKKLFGTK
jgi:hypothetical protein